MKIKRWGVYLVDLNPRVGTKPGKSRPCVVVQDDALNDINHPSTVILPITTKNAADGAYPLRVFLQKGEGGVKKDCVVMVDQFLAWDNARFIKHLGDLGADKREKLEAACREFFGW
ncbi:MAG: type II toxin-antitoxin system PemK/MazF family toxin [Deltaproteobacteria bacterium]|nr:type II toxin-antitoxin system PemK/MazF family toxin [Deltaproteobacteria bacterium]